MSTSYVEQFHVLQAKPRMSGSRVGTIVAIEPRAVVDFRGNPFGPQRARIAASLTAEMISTACAANLPVLLVFEDDDPARPVIVDVVVDQPLDGTDRRLAIPNDEHRDLERTVAGGDAEVCSAGLARIVGIEAEVVMVERVDDATALPFGAKTAITLRNLKDPVVLLDLADGSSVIVGQVRPAVTVEPEGGSGAEVLLKGSTVRIEADIELILTAGACRVELDARGKAITTADHIVSRARGANKVQGGSVQLN
jgi:hypothetical protein